MAHLLRMAAWSGRTFQCRDRRLSLRSVASCRGQRFIPGKSSPRSLPSWGCGRPSLHVSSRCRRTGSVKSFEASGRSAAIRHCVWDIGSARAANFGSIFKALTTFASLRRKQAPRSRAFPCARRWEPVDGGELHPVGWLERQRNPSARVLNPPARDPPCAGWRRAWRRALRGEACASAARQGRWT